MALDFEGDLAEAQGRAVRVRADGPVAFAEGSEGEGARVGEGAVLLGRGNDFLHGRDALAIGFDLKKDDAGEHGRVLHLPKAFESWVTPEGAFEFLLWTDEGQFRVETEAGAVSDTGWHHVEIGYDDATDRMRLEVDGEVHEARASGTTAEGSLWGAQPGHGLGRSARGHGGPLPLRRGARLGLRPGLSRVADPRRPQPPRGGARRRAGPPVAARASRGVHGV